MNKRSSKGWKFSASGGATLVSPAANEPKKIILINLSQFFASGGEIQE